jgi:hypothetical protein
MVLAAIAQLLFAFELPTTRGEFGSTAGIQPKIIAHVKAVFGPQTRSANSHETTQEDFVSVRLVSGIGFADQKLGKGRSVPAQQTGASVSSRA